MNRTTGAQRHNKRQDKIWETYKAQQRDKTLTKYRIKNSDGTIHNAGTGENSWFTLDDARKIVDYGNGQMIVEHDGVNILWEVL